MESNPNLILEPSYDEINNDVDHNNSFSNNETSLSIKPNVSEHNSSIEDNQAEMDYLFTKIITKHCINDSAKKDILNYIRLVNETKTLPFI